MGKRLFQEASEESKSRPGMRMIMQDPRLDMHYITHMKNWFKERILSLLHIPSFCMRHLPGWCEQKVHFPLATWAMLEPWYS